MPTFGLYAKSKSSPFVISACPGRSGPKRLDAPVGALIPLDESPEHVVVLFKTPSLTTWRSHSSLATWWSRASLLTWWSLRIAPACSQLGCARDHSGQLFLHVKNGGIISANRRDHYFICKKWRDHFRRCFRHILLFGPIQRRGNDPAAPAKPKQAFLLGFYWGMGCLG